MAGDKHSIPPAVVRAQLRRILDSRDFETSERNQRFLEYVTEETLAGRAERIKAYCVATEVFGREESFDPQTDPIVRIEASRLRRALERYYLTRGSDDPIRITIPKGSYVPAFELADAVQTTTGADDLRAPAQGHAKEHGAAPTEMGSPRRSAWRTAGGKAAIGLAVAWLGAAWLADLPPFADPAGEARAVRHGPAIFVAPFEDAGNPSALPNFTRGFTREVIVALTRFNDLFVFGPETTFRYGEEGELQQIVAGLGVDFVLNGAATVAGDHFVIEALLVDAGTGQYLWAERFEGMLGVEGIVSTRDQVANRVARSLAQPYGVIFTNQVKESMGKPPESLSSYDCVTRFYLYWKAFRREEYRPVRSCLEQAIVLDSDYAEAFAALSLLHSDAYRFGFDDGPYSGDPLHMALDLARRAITLAPGSARGHHALSLAYWLVGDVEQSLEALRGGLALNPNDTELMAELGMRYAWRNQWETGLPLLREAFARNPGQPSGYRLPLSLDHYRNLRYREALAEARKIETPDLVFGHAVLAMAAAQLGLTDEAEAAVRRILAINPEYADQVVGDLEKRNIHPDLIPLVVDGLRKAGLPISGLAHSGKL